MIRIKHLPFVSPCTLPQRSILLRTRLCAFNSKAKEGPRQIAITQLVRIDKGAYSSLVADEVIDCDTEEAARDRRESTLLVAGVERMRLKIDHILQHYLSKPLKLLPSRILQLFRMAVYELVELKKPKYIANEYVNLSKNFKELSSLVNAILRTIGDDLDNGKCPIPSVDPSKEKHELIHDLSIRYSHPEWMISRWMERFGLQGTIELMKENNRIPTQGVRMSPGTDPAAELALLTEINVKGEISPYLPSTFLRISLGLQRVLSTLEFRIGQYAIQDESAGLVVTAALQPQAGDYILDCCCAPGGKLIFMAQLMEGQGKITAIDRSETRLRMTKDAAKLFRVDGMIDFECTNIQDFGTDSVEQTKKNYDKVLLDAPCTGTGVMAKKADLRWKTLPENLDELAKLQDELLEVASQFVKPGGFLVYSTCSIEPEENEERVQHFISNHPEFEIAPLPDNLDESLVSENGSFQTLPHIHKVNGAFAARLQHIVN